MTCDARRSAPGGGSGEEKAEREKKKRRMGTEGLLPKGEREGEKVTVRSRGNLENLKKKTATGGERRPKEKERQM